MARVVSPEFVGRQSELAELVSTLAAVDESGCQVVFVAGEAGAGKTRLVKEVERHGLERGMLVLRGECLELQGGGLPYGPVISALQRLPEQALAAALEGLPPAANTELARLLPIADAGPLRSSSAQDVPYAKARLFELLLRLLRCLAADASLLLLIEDLHWADAATRDFVAYLARNGERARLALVVTYRSDELTRGDPDGPDRAPGMRRFVGELRRWDNVREVHLHRLVRNEVVRQLDAILGRPAEQHLVDEIHARSEGNPFFVEELLAAWAAEGEVVLPDSLLDALLLRVEALPDEAREVVRALGVVGRPARQSLLASVLGVPEPALSKPLRAALGRHVLTYRKEDESFEFCHALVREAVCADLLPGERKPLHAAVARALERSGGGSAAELAWHWEAAEEPALALPAHIRAGGEAENVYAFAEARRHFAAALRLWPAPAEGESGDGSDEIELLRRAADAARFTGDSHGAVELGARALAGVDQEQEPLRAALLHERMGEYIFWGEEARIASYERALRLLPRGCDADRSRILGAKALALHYLFRWSEACVCAEEAIRTARRAGAAAEEAHARMTLGTARAFLGDPEDGEVQVLEAQRVAEQLPRPEQRLRIRAHLAEVLRIRGRTGDALALMESGEGLAAELGMSGSFGQVMGMNAAEDLFQLGRWDEATERLRSADRMALNDAGELLKHCILGHLAAARGRFEEAHLRLRQAHELCSDETSCDYLAGVYAAGAELALWEERLDDAQREVAHGLRLVGDLEDPLYTPILYSLGARVEAELAERATAARDPAAGERARAAAEDLLAGIGRLIDRHAAKIAPAEASAHRSACEAELARILKRPAAELWRGVALQWDLLERPYPAAYARWRQAESMLADSGRGAQAAEILALAHHTARELGAAPLQGEIEALQRRARIVPDDGPGAVAAPSATRPFGLTSRELEVLALMAEGFTNRQIADHLFITVNTAGVHVSHILTKMDAENRVTAAGIAHRLRLVDTPQTLTQGGSSGQEEEEADEYVRRARHV